MSSDDILFNYIPAAGLAAPLFTFEVNSGGQYDEEDRFIIVAHATAAGSLQPGVPTPVSDQNTADLLAGPGSQLREMFRVAAMNAPAAPFYLLALPEVGTAAVWTLTVNALSGPGMGTVVIKGETLPISVGATDTSTTIAAAIASAINNYYNPLTLAMLPVTASVSGIVVTITARHKGAIFNEIDFYFPLMAGTNVFSGGVVTMAQTTAGAGVPVVGSALAAIAEGPKDYIVCPWSDPTSLAAYTALTNDQSGSWSWARESFGHVWTAQTGTFAGLVTLGQTLNDRHLTIIGRLQGAQAAFTGTFPTNPAAGTTMNIGGTAVTFVAASPTGNQVLIGAAVAGTIANLVALVNATSTGGLGKFTATAGSLPGTFVLTAVDPSPLGNFLALSTTVANATIVQSTTANGSPHGSWLWVAAIAARLSPWLSDCDTGNVSRNHTGLPVLGVAPPRDRTVYQNYNGRNVLVQTGISTWKTDRTGALLIDKIVTTYTTNLAGNPDIVFRDIQSVYQVAGGLKYLRALLATEHGNKAIADDNPGSLGAISTPADIKGTFIHGYSDLVNNGVFEDPSTYAKTLVVSRDKINRARVNVYNPMQRVSPLDILATNATIYTKFPDAA